MILCIYLQYTADEFIVNRVKEQLACETIHDAAAAKKTYLAKIKTRQNQTKRE